MQRKNEGRYRKGNEMAKRKEVEGEKQGKGNERGWKERTRNNVGPNEEQIEHSI